MISLLFVAFFLALAVYLLIRRNFNRNNKIWFYNQLSGNEIAGEVGEFLIYQKLRSLERDGVKILRNLYIPKPNNQYTEIDLLVISSKGLFVIESKNFSGWIFGKEHERYWTQCLSIGNGYSRKEIFYNPIWQNRNHIKHLQSHIGKHLPIYSVIVFSDRVTFKNVPIQHDGYVIIYLSELNRFFKEIYNNSKMDLLSQETIDYLYNKFLPHTNLNKRDSRPHV